MTPIVCAFDASVTTNADLIERAGLIYLGPHARVLDCTYGQGAWWKKWQPEQLVRSDLLPTGDLVASFAQLPFRDATFDAVAFDPPYVPMGGVASSTTQDFNARYGRPALQTVDALRTLYTAGMTEAGRVVKPSGILLAKCQNFVWSGKFVPFVYWVVDHAVGFELIDWMYLSRPPGPQPRRFKRHKTCKGRGCDDCDHGKVESPQVHSRQNVSHLLVFRRKRDVYRSVER